MSVEGASKRREENIALVIGPGAPREYLEKGEVACITGSCSKGFDIGCLEKLGEDKGIGRRSGLGNEVCSGSGRICRL